MATRKPPRMIVAKFDPDTGSPTVLQISDVIESSDAGRVERQRNINPENDLPQSVQDKITAYAAALFAWLEANVPHDS